MLRVGYMLGFVLLFLGMGGCALRTPEPAGPDSFRLMTYNVNFGLAGADAAIAVIRNASADVVCLQETSPEWEAVLRPALAATYPHMAFRTSVARPAGGLAVLSKYPVEQIAYVESDTGWFDQWIVRVQLPLGDVQVANVHLQPPASDRGGFTLGSLLFTEQRRQRELDRVMQHTRDDSPLLVVGDFNDDERSGVVRSLEKHGLTSALGQFDATTPTWRWPVGAITLSRRIDHIVYRGLRCHHAYVLQQGPSDHFPVVAVLGPVPPKRRGG